MGSLPNLNDLRQEKSQRRATAERERDAARERAQQLENIRRDQLPTLLQVKHKVHPIQYIYIKRIFVMDTTIPPTSLNVRKPHGIFPLNLESVVVWILF